MNLRTSSKSSPSALPAIGENEFNSQSDASLLIPSAKGGVRLRTQVMLRWLAIAGQCAAILAVHFSLGFDLPVLPCLAAIAASAFLNIWLMFAYPTAHRLGKREAGLYHAYDLVQLAVLVYFTGGLENPFSLLFIVPVTISATTLPLVYTIALGALSLVFISGLAFYHEPLPWWPREILALPSLYIAGVWVSLGLGIVFIAAYAWRIAAEAARMSDALNATQAVLAKAQRLSALDGLAAAAAHELGTPLGTIALVANELKSELPANSAHREDIVLIAGQAERCREILARLSTQPEEGDAHFARVGLDVLIAELIEPYRGFGVQIETKLRPAREGDAIPFFLRRPDITYGLGNLIENAVDFAASRVVIEAAWTDSEVSITVNDDGPGIAAEVRDRLGEPYVTTRRFDSSAGTTEDHVGMGLGFFIAKTLLERSGARMRLGDETGQRKGASITISWLRPAPLSEGEDKATSLY
jgi:two-component system sensor histidine kinase RegB